MSEALREHAMKVIVTLLIGWLATSAGLGYATQIRISELQAELDRRPDRKETAEIAEDVAPWNDERELVLYRLDQILDEFKELRADVKKLRESLK